MAKVAINGLGRIGRAALRVILNTPELELVAVNDLVPADNLAYLLRYDSVYGRFDKDVTAEGNALIIAGKRCPVFSEKDPSQLPWKSLGVDIVFECTGRFASREGMENHLKAGARHVILSTTSKSDDVPTIVHGVNYPEKGATLISNSSCTTNSVAPVMEIIGRRIGIKKAILTTVHAYTSSQAIVDSPNKKFARGRAAAVNIVPTNTGAAVATTKVLPQHRDRFGGTALRVPVPSGSISDITMVTERPTSVEEVNAIFREEAASPRYRGIFGISEDPIVSSDIIEDSRASVADLSGTQVVDGDLVKVMTWYDNEWGFTNQMIRTALDIAKQTQGAAV